MDERFSESQKRAIRDIFRDIHEIQDLAVKDMINEPDKLVVCSKILRYAKCNIRAARIGKE